MKILLRLLSLYVLMALGACLPRVDPVDNPGKSGNNAGDGWNKGAMVSAANPHAVAAARDVLARGGHAVDAAIAAHAVLGLVEPQSSGIGGSVFMLVYDRETDSLTVYDGRETAPAGIGTDTFMRDGEPMGFREAWPFGISVGVPGAVAAYQAAHDAHGRLPWADIFQPAITLAQDGFKVSPRLHGFIERFQPMIDPDDFPVAAMYLFPGGEPLAVNHTLKNPEYAETLGRIAGEGSRVFYHGDIAEAIVRSAQADPVGGSLTLQDVSGYRVMIREAVCGGFRDDRICTAPPPSSGLANIMMAGLYDELLSDQDKRLTDKVRAFVDAQRLAYADRDHFVGDTAFVEVPVRELIDPAYIVRRAGERFAPGEIPTHGNPGRLSGQDRAAWNRAEDSTRELVGTTHLSIIDNYGNAVSMTASVGAIFGSLRMTNGFFLNNELLDFARSPLSGGQLAANAPAPGKRPRSSMSPTIVFDENGELLMLTGSPGGNSILAYTTKTILAVLDWGYSAQEAADLPNIIARGQTVRVETSGELGRTIAADLNAAGYEVQERQGENSGIHLIVVRPQGLEGGADSRREGVVAAIDGM